MGSDSLAARRDANCAPGLIPHARDSTSLQCRRIERSLKSPDILLPQPREKVRPGEPDETQLWPPVSSSEDSASTTSSSTTSTMTDSGTTHTIPNDEVITVTKHTLVTDEEPPTAPTESPPPLTGSGAPEPTSTGPADSSTPAGEPGSPAGNGGAPISTGAIAGIAVGGLVLIIVSVVFFVVLKRRRKAARDASTGPYSGTVRDDFYDDKHFPPSMSPHTTGTQEPGDPFAPFGGRADEPQLPQRPRDGAVEMEATSAAPVELPAMSVQPKDTSSRSTPASTGEPSVAPVRQPPSRDPRATLNTLRGENGKPAYVNHWDQYRAMGGG